MDYTLTSTPFAGLLPQAQADSVCQLIKDVVQSEYADHANSDTELNETLHQYASYYVFQRESGVVDVYSLEKDCPCGGLLFHVGYVYSNGKSIENWGGEFQPDVYTGSEIAYVEFNYNGQPCV